jgi:hypothetical protein
MQFFAGDGFHRLTFNYFRNGQGRISKSAKTLKALSLPTAVFAHERFSAEFLGCRRQFGTFFALPTGRVFGLTFSNLTLVFKNSIYQIISKMA